uniref:TGME49_116130 n=1 Tax=Toxoplasma gondii (strain ATCC 50861 / VEG) TaxID=432359 RepID=A0A0F7V982_TOXGV|nr:TPA: TGME49_116130 [Toxoplasma gondii VEG]
MAAVLPRSRGVLPVLSLLVFFVVGCWLCANAVEELDGEGTQQLRVRPVDSRLLSSSGWRKLRKGLLDLLKKESAKREWIPIHVHKVPEGASDAETTLPPSSLGFFGRLFGRNPVEDDLALSALGTSLPRGLNAALEIYTQPDGELECRKSPWVLPVVVEEVRKRASAEGVPFFEAAVSYGYEDANDTIAANLPIVFPLTPNNQILKNGLPDVEPQVGLDATILCKEDGRPPLFVTDQDENSDMPELQPGPWTVSVFVRSKVNPLVPYGRSYFLEVLDNVVVTMPPERIIPFPLPASVSLDTLLQLELAVAAAQLFTEPRSEDSMRLAMPARCTIHRDASYLDAATLDCPLWHMQAHTKKPSGVVNLNTAWPHPASAAEKLALSRLSEKALNAFAANESNAKSPFTLSADGDTLDVSVDVNKLSAKEKKGVENLPTDSDGRLQFSLNGRPAGDAVGNADAAVGPALRVVHNIYRATVTNPYENAKNELMKNVALGLAFAVLFHSGMRLWSWWQDDKTTRHKLALIEAARSAQHFEPKYLVKPAQATDVLAEIVPDDIRS